MAATIGMPGSAQARDRIDIAEMEVTLDAGNEMLTVELVSDIGWNEGAGLFIVPVRIVLEQVVGTQDYHGTVEAIVIEARHGDVYMVIPRHEAPGGDAAIRLFIRPGELPTAGIDGDTMRLGPVHAELPDEGLIDDIVVGINKLRPRNGDPD